MKPNAEVRALLRTAGIRTSPARDESVLADALRVGGLNRDTRVARREPRVWRTIMKSRATKFATAAVIIAAIIITLSQFNQPVVKAVEFAEMARAMQQVPWMHAAADTRIGPAAGRIEVWINFPAKVQAGITREGKVNVSRFKEHEKAEYDPNSRTITLSYAREDEFSPTVSSPALIGENICKTLKDQGAEIVIKLGDYRGRKVQVQEMSLSLPQQGMQHYVVKLYVDPQSKLLQGYEATSVNDSGVVIGSAGCTYDYPQTGPRDIYDLGVPRTARIVNAPPQANGRTVPRQPDVPSQRPVPMNESGNISFEEAWRQALTVIRERQTWPESPVAVCKAYWAARSQKHYAEMEILWPGSASYNWAELCKNDPNVDYVFGAASPDGTQVPYAAKDYLETNHKYNLTMWLHKMDTDKGPRYYVVSGN
jgi:hypothetical protein